MSICFGLKVLPIYVGGCQNYGPLLGTLNIRCRTILGAFDNHPCTLDPKYILLGYMDR